MKIHQDSKNYSLSLNEIKQLERGAWWRGVACTFIVMMIVLVSISSILYNMYIIVD
jgi:hypothetical protein